MIWEIAEVSFFLLLFRGLNSVIISLVDGIGLTYTLLFFEPIGFSFFTFCWDSEMGKLSFEPHSDIEKYLVSEKQTILSWHQLVLFKKTNWVTTGMF